jgi:hypothetical protein
MTMFQSSTVKLKIQGNNFGDINENSNQFPINSTEAFG